MRTITLFTFIIVSSLSLVACGPDGGDDSGDDDGDDTADAPDANNTVDPPDAMVTQVTGLGAPCTPDGANPMGQGDCEAGFVCLNLSGGAGPWCSKQCDAAKGADPIAQCDPSLTAPTGLGYCLWQVDFDGENTGNPPVPFCGIICEDLTATPCADNGATCDGTCPAPQACAADLGGQATACQ